ncbi:ABC transporter substrate-binding protein [Paracoccus sp. Z330]|uniref:ABC transporter substrate-binding protein n=1 Tax=Paracoccus onchidii TaxID=3017813 RepID=A0ABT4ZC94_9RHOB|nr:ABC transporter substrate-binding protein [Paracoccus onchidii]MDB6176762.1 ABC transporter substrate-binding protein [Paracoccus onchidii]
MEIDRRRLLALGGAAAFALTAGPVSAMTASSAQGLIQSAVDDVFKVINSGQSPARMYQQFEAVFARYADVNIIARSVLGPPARQIGDAEFAAYRSAFQGYIGRKYGKRFREFIGSQIEVEGAHPLKSYYAVDAVAYLNGRAPMDIEWHVSDKSGQVRFFNLIIEGVNMLASERAEMAAMLSRRKGDVAALTEDLKRAG